MLMLVADDATARRLEDEGGGGRARGKEAEAPC
jgi:hypothetical protein